MIKKAVCLLWVIFFLLMAQSNATETNGFKLEKIGQRIYRLTDTGDNSKQLALVGKRGVVILNSFWSKATADKFKKEWRRCLKRDDFNTVINTFDRIDYFGGNGAYSNAAIIAHRSFTEKFDQESVDREVKKLIAMWREKADISRKRLSEHEPGSEKEKSEKSWLLTCERRADELEQSSSLVLPTRVYDDRMTLNLGDISIELIYFGRAGYEGLTLVVVPEERIAILPEFIMNPFHLAPYPHPEFARLEVPRWIRVLEEILQGERAVDTVLLEGKYRWGAERALSHLNYIKKLWERVKALESEGSDLDEIQKLCSLDGDFAFVREIQSYRDTGDGWMGPQHRMNVTNYFHQHKNLAIEMIKKEAAISGYRAAIEKTLRQREQGNDLYFGEESINTLGYSLMFGDQLEPAIEVFKLNVVIHPDSANAHDSLAQACLKKGDTREAIKHYEISLKLNPGNENARKMLEKLNKKE